MKSILSVVLAGLMVFSLVGCNAQSEAVALLNAAGPAVASVVAAISPANAKLADQIKADFAAAAVAVGAFKKGSPCQNVEQALNLVLQDLNLIPGTGQYAVLIGVAVAAVESVLAVIPACQASASKNPIHMPRMPMSVKEFKARWNAELAKNPSLKAAPVK